ncbi:DNA cytosine methyltransferase [Bdellovibrio sp. HCB288]|uniref:DNA cytosine methyltransferase n=1 Tax=Bdellovibrio sp. HCB288 TaxID=3394355 RepID=UPI0039B3EE38
MQKYKKRSFFSLDLFSGCGGTALGIDAAGFESIGHVEIDPVANKTLELNFGVSPLSSIKAANGDVTKINLKVLKKELISHGINSLDLLVASPPCQGFSAVGRAKLNSLSSKCFSKDPRNKLYKSVLEHISFLKPKAVLFENVPGMLNVRGINFAEIFCDELNSLGYNVKVSLLNSSWYGVPQSRERVFIVGYRKDLGIAPKFPHKTHNVDNVGGAAVQPIRLGVQWKSPDYYIDPDSIPEIANVKLGVSAENAFADLPKFQAHLKEGYRPSRDIVMNYEDVPLNSYCSLMRNWPGFESDFLADHFCRRNPRDYPIFKKMKSGDTYPEALEIANAIWSLTKLDFSSGKISKLPLKNKVVPPYRSDSFAQKWRKLYPDRLSWTLTAHLEKDGYSHIHFDSKQARTITPREAARLQSFPDGFKFHGTMGRMFKQIGNAIAPLVAEALAKQIILDLQKSELSKPRSKRLGSNDVESYS